MVPGLKVKLSMEARVSAGKALAAAMPHSRTVILDGAGHMLMAERPDAVLAAIRR